MNLDVLLKTPKYYSAIISSTGLLSGIERENRIRKFLDINIWLAARCKNTCVLEEDTILDAILLKCASKIENEQDPLSIVALLELGEVGVICYLFNVSDNVALKLYQDPNQSVAHLFRELGDIFTTELFWAVYRKIDELGYSMDIELYNFALSKSLKEEDTSLILNDMESSGVKADARTYFHLISKSTSYHDALPFYNGFLDEKSQDITLIYGVATKMILLAPSQDIVEGVYRTSNPDSCDNLLAKRTKSAYFGRMIELSEDYRVCAEYLNEARDFISEKSRRSRLFDYVVSGFSMRLYRTSAHEIDLFFFKSFTLFCELTHIVCPEGYFKNKPRDNNRKRYFINAAIRRVISRLPSSHMVFELFRAMETNDLEIDSVLVRTAVEISDSKDYLRRLLRHYVLMNADERWIVNCVKRFGVEIADYFYEYLIENKYQPNIYLYNTLINKSTFERALYYLGEMKNHHIPADEFTIQSLLRKFSDKDGFLKILSIVSDYQIKPEMQMYRTLIQRAHFDKEIKKGVLSVNNLDIESLALLPSWERFLADAQVELGQII